jgi:methylthioribose-1-phosphate isomerase
MPGTTFKTIDLHPGTRDATPVLVLLDQRFLPGEVKYVELRDAVETAKAIKDMVTRGAPAIGCTAAFGYYLAANASASTAGTTLSSFTAAMDDAYEILESSRPTAVNLRWALDRLRKLLSAMSAEMSLVDRASAVLKDAHAIYAEDEAACRAMGAHGLGLVQKSVFPGKGARIIHHCNTGSLATSCYGTALGLVRAAFEADPSIHVYGMFWSASTLLPR